MKLTIIVRGMILLIFTTSCSGLLPSSTPTPTSIPDTETPSPTIVWFPPTDTPTLFFTQTLLSTPDQRPGLVELLFTDTFNKPDLWQISSDSISSASVTGNRLILSISGQGPRSIKSLRSEPALQNFYAEATVKLSLCGDKDQFGILFRVVPAESFYRFTVRCDGQARIERSTESTMPLLDWLTSGDAPIAAPAEVKLGVWAMGGDLRFFLNDRFQFSVKDPVLHTGTLGFFVYAEGTDPITASFSDLSVYSVFFISATPSLTPSRTPTPSRTTIPSRTPTQ